jgi:hypothetical protein
VRERETVGGEVRVGSETPAGARRGRGDAGWISAESGPAQVRSSNRASLPGRAEGRFSVELGTARLSRPELTNSEIARNLG